MCNKIKWTSINLMQWKFTLIYQTEECFVHMLKSEKLDSTRRQDRTGVTSLKFFHQKNCPLILPHNVFLNKIPNMIFYIIITEKRRGERKKENFSQFSNFSVVVSFSIWIQARMEELDDGKKREWKIESILQNVSLSLFSYWFSTLGYHPIIS